MLSRQLRGVPAPFSSLVGLGLVSPPTSDRFTLGLESSDSSPRPLPPDCHDAGPLLLAPCHRAQQPPDSALAPTQLPPRLRTTPSTPSRSSPRPPAFGFSSAAFSHPRPAPRHQPESDFMEAPLSWPMTPPPRTAPPRPHAPGLLTPCHQPKSDFMEGPLSWPTTPRPRTAPLGLGQPPFDLVSPSASDRSPRRSAPDCSTRPRIAPPWPRLPLGLGLPPSPRLRTASATSISQLQHVAIQSVHVHGSGGHSPPLPCSHSKCSHAWKLGPFSSSSMQPFKVFTCMEVGAIILPSPCSHLPAAQPLTPFLSLSLSLLCPRTGVESSNSPVHGRP